ncbi:acetylxylan esterase [Enterococcus sp. AD013-P3]|uniref:acetylxylan esterase n=1 Tax=Enterococcus sp. AD013-P3 TaxID=3411036 RepID=UPI003B947D44
MNELEKERFWDETAAQLAAIPLELELSPKVITQPKIKCFSISFKSLQGEKIHGLLLLPEITHGKVPVVVDILGYMTHIQNAEEFAHWPQIGCGCLVIDNRGQGGQTLDTAPYLTTNGESPMVRGLLTPEDSYMRRLVADQMRLFSVIDAIPELDNDQIFLHGNSQGGGLALLLNGICRKKIRATLANVPSHSNISRRVHEKTGSYGAIADYLLLHPEDEQHVLATLAVFDTKYYAKRIANPVFTSAASADTTCPMKDFLVTYRRLAAPKSLTVYWGKGHEGGGSRQLAREISLMKQLTEELNKDADCNL